MKKVIIAGVRKINDIIYSDYDCIKNTILEILPDICNGQYEIVSGNAVGVDRLGERFARENGIHVKQFLPEWNDYEGNFDPEAGFKRNRKMANYADILIAFAAEESSTGGTGDMIEQMDRLNKKVYIRMIQ
jgi:hypothetical protein